MKELSGIHHGFSRHHSKEQTASSIHSSPLTIAATDGFPLAATLYSLLHAPIQDVVIINSGAGVRRRFYHAFALFLAERGFTVLTYDYRGIGDSLRGRLRQSKASISIWGQCDTTAVLDWAWNQAQHLGTKTPRISMIGHSAGGKVVGFAPNNDKLTALVTICTPNSYWGLRRSRLRRGFALFVHGIMPAMTHLWGYFPSSLVGLGEDYPKGVALEWARWSRYERYIRDERAQWVSNAPLYFDNLTAPILAYSIEDDFIAQEKAVLSLMKFYTNARVHEHRHIVPAQYHIKRIGHSGFFRTVVKPVWIGLVDWLQQQHGYSAL